MAANANDLFMEVGNPGTATTLSAPGYTAGGTTITVGSTSNWPTATGTIFAIDEAEVVNGVEVQIAGTYNEYEGVVSTGTSVTSVDWVRGVGDRSYSAGALTRVYVPVSAERENRLAQGMVIQHNQDGTHSAVTATSVTTSGAVLTSPKVITSVNDTNGNELFKVTATASAVNEVTLANAATGGNPTLSATGNDANIHLNLTGKGTGGVLTKNPYKFRAYRAGAATVSNGAYGKVPFETETYDTASNYDNVTNFRFTAPIAGFYQFNWRVSHNNAGTHRIVSVLFKNGVAASRGSDTTAPFAGSSGSDCISLAATDYVEVYALTTTAALGFDPGADIMYFSGFLVSAT